MKCMETFLYKPDIKIEWRIHALQQISIRNIHRLDVLDVLKTGEVIESYPDDTPYPSFLLCGFNNGRPLHIVIAHAQRQNTLYVVTAYEPDCIKWKNNYRRKI